MIVVIVKGVHWKVLASFRVTRFDNQKQLLLMLLQLLLLLLVSVWQISIYTTGMLQAGAKLLACGTKLLAIVCCLPLLPGLDRPRVCFKPLMQRRIRDMA